MLQQAPRSIGAQILLCETKNDQHVKTNRLIAWPVSYPVETVIQAIDSAFETTETVTTDEAILSLPGVDLGGIPGQAKFAFNRFALGQLQKIAVGGDFFSKQRNCLGIVGRCLKILQLLQIIVDIV